MSFPIPDASFWRGRRVFLTGHTGFVGGWTALWLKQLGAEVHAFTLAGDEAPRSVLRLIELTDEGLSKRLGGGVELGQGCCVAD